jgi:hypothetical protein
MDAVRKGTLEEQQLIMNTLEMIAKKKEEEKNLAEVKNRQDAIELNKFVDDQEEMRDREMGPKADATDLAGSDDKKSLGYQERIAKAVEKMADTNPIVLEPLGGIA